MRLYEIMSPTFYLASTKPHRRGQVVAVTGTVHPLGALLEGRLESTRPEGFLSRQESLYLHPTSSVVGDYVFEVAPIGRIERFHSAWLRKLQEVSVGSAGEIDQLCKAYWSGQECPEARHEPWEYRSSQAKIIKRVADALSRSCPDEAV